MTKNPYVGLRPFEEDDGDRFFGRDDESTRLINRLFSRRTTVLHAPYGAGKTSFLRVRVIPALSAPGERIAVLLVDDWNQDPLASLQKGIGLQRDREAALAESARSQMFVVIFDQFEQFLIRLRRNATSERCKEFLKHVQTLIRERDDIFFLCSLRDEFFANLEALKAYDIDIFANSFRLGGLGDKDALDAMLKPAQSTGRVFHGDLGARLLNDLKEFNQNSDRSANASAPFVEGPSLPLLQIACHLLWQRSDKDITLDTYRQAGDLPGIIKKWIEGSMSPFTGQQRIAAAIILQHSAMSGVKVPLVPNALARQHNLDPHLTQQVLKTLEERGILRTRPLPRTTSDAPRADEGPPLLWELTHDALHPMLDRWGRDVVAERTLRRYVLLAILVCLVVGGAAGVVIVGYRTEKAQWASLHSELAALGPYDDIAPPDDIALRLRWQALERFLGQAKLLDSTGEKTLGILTESAGVIPLRRRSRSNDTPSQEVGKRDAIVVELDTNQFRIDPRDLHERWRGRADKLADHGVALPRDIRVMTPRVETTNKSEFSVWYPTRRSWSVRTIKWPLNHREEYLFVPKAPTGDAHSVVDLLRSIRREHRTICDSGFIAATGDALCSLYRDDRAMQHALVSPRWARPFWAEYNLREADKDDEELLVDLLSAKLTNGELGEPAHVLYCSMRNLWQSDGPTSTANDTDAIAALSAMLRPDGDGAPTGEGSPAETAEREQTVRPLPLPLLVFASHEASLPAASDDLKTRTAQLKGRADELQTALLSERPSELFTLPDLPPDILARWKAGDDDVASNAAPCDASAKQSETPLLELEMNGDRRTLRQLREQIVVESLRFYEAHGIVPPQPRLELTRLAPQQYTARLKVWGTVVPISQDPSNDRAEFVRSTVDNLRRFWDSHRAFWITPNQVEGWLKQDNDSRVNPEPFAFNKLPGARPRVDELIRPALTPIMLSTLRALASRDSHAQFDLELLAEVLRPVVEQWLQEVAQKPTATSEERWKRILELTRWDKRMMEAHDRLRARRAAALVEGECPELDDIEAFHMTHVALQSPAANATAAICHIQHLLDRDLIGQATDILEKFAASITLKAVRRKEEMKRRRQAGDYVLDDDSPANKSLVRLATEILFHRAGTAADQDTGQMKAIRGRVLGLLTRHGKTLAPQPLEDNLFVPLLAACAGAPAAQSWCVDGLQRLSTSLAEEGKRSFWIPLLLAHLLTEDPSTTPQRATAALTEINTARRRLELRDTIDRPVDRNQQKVRLDILEIGARQAILGPGDTETQKLIEVLYEEATKDAKALDAPELTIRLQHLHVRWLLRLRDFTGALKVVDGLIQQLEKWSYLGASEQLFRKFVLLLLVENGGPEAARDFFKAQAAMGFLASARLLGHAGVLVGEDPVAAHRNMERYIQSAEDYDNSADFGRVFLYWHMRRQADGEGLALGLLKDRWGEIDPSSWDERDGVGDRSTWGETLIGYAMSSPEAIQRLDGALDPTSKALDIGQRCELLLYRALIRLAHGDTKAARADLEGVEATHLLSFKEYIYAGHIRRTALDAGAQAQKSPP